MTGTQCFTAVCGCSFEELVDDQGNVELFYAHNICPTHEPLVKNKPKLSKAEFNNRRDQVLSTYEGILDNNRTRGLKQFDDDPFVKKGRSAIADMKKENALERHALKLEAKLDADRGGIDNTLIKFKDDNMARALGGLYSEYALIAEEVFDVVKGQNPNG